MEIYPFLFMAMHFMLLLFTATSTHNNFTDLSALLAFKAGVSDPNGILSANWTTNTSFCTWTGVFCSHRMQRVVALDIKDSLLYGTIAPHIGNLSFLSYISLVNNSLVGPIPDSLSQLPRLKSLRLGENQLSGSIPPTIFNMSSLVELFLRFNKFSGTFPSNDSLHSMLPRIQDLAVSSNLLTGNIPSSLARCRDLHLLSLADNQFSGNINSELGNLKQLKHLYLGDNYITGTIPTSLGNLTNLLELDLPYNGLHGDIPKELGGLSNLQRLNLGANYGITGPVPISLSNISSLKQVDLNSNKLTGMMHLQFGNMPHLETLFLSQNKLTGGLEFLASLSNCRNLVAVDLGGNELGGSLPNTIGNLSRILQIFTVNTNHIKGKISAELGNLTSLSTLNLGDNELGGKIPSEIGMLENLQSLTLENNMLYGSIPRELSQLRNLNTLSLRGNTLSGSIPDSVGNISRLQHLILSGNALSSAIPQTMWSLTGLIELGLSENFLSGLLSTEVGNLKSLDTFNLSMNQLSGIIPSTLKELQMARYLDLSNNSFDGQIPQSFGELINIEVLNFSCNNLSGAIPNSLSNLRFLKSINLSFNNLEGEIPKGGAFFNLTIASLMGNAALCGAPRLGFPSCPKNTAISNSRTRTLCLKYILPAIASAVILVACFCVLLKSLQKKTKNLAPASTPSGNNYQLISYHELVRATENFSEANFLGRGSFGTVYKGCLDDGLLVAIKVLNLEVDGASRSFDVECRALSMVRHRNLVKLISTCSNFDFKALILQFMPNGNLERMLYSYNNYLNLLQRINIVLDVASALEYLHHHHPQVVLHCDLKPSNVLLDEDMTAHVGDFGIAKALLGDSRTMTSASTLGTIGYIAPEYASMGRVSRKGDIYSFGILLLETFTRKKPNDPMFVGDLSLRQWVCEAHPSALLEIVDCNLLKDVRGNEKPSEDLISTSQCISSLLELGTLCSTDSPKERPAMKEVVPRLHKIKAVYLTKFPNASNKP